MPPSSPRRPRLALDRQTGEAVQRGHPWVYRDQLAKDHGLAPGDDVELWAGGAFLARALVDPASSIPIRVWSRDADAPPFSKAIAARVARARSWRERSVSSQVTGFRLLHGEGDGMPGLVVDRYAGVLVVRTYWGAWEPWMGQVVEALRSQGGPGLIAIVRAASVGTAPAEEDSSAEAAPLWGKAPPEVEIREGDRKYLVQPGKGQKTGFFLDQRPQRDRIQEWARPGERALNLFSFTGGFSVALALGGAREVVSVDVAAGALETARDAFVRSGIEPAPHRFVPQDVFAFLEEEGRQGKPYDVVVCDPPAFARSAAQVEGARKAYHRLHRSLARVLVKGGVLLTASCTARITEGEFLREAHSGLSTGGRSFIVMGRGGPGPDHPVPAGFPEGNYLKALWGRVE